MNLYLKYRPKTIDELDLASVRKALSAIVTANRTAHAYLLTGPRGAGKTSAARILARIVNCEENGEKLGEPCNKCAACTSILLGSAFDVIEIDAASNRGIDDIRDLKEKIKLAPAVLRTKVYIIDEVHMLTSEAFNALLKTLEEPPTHSLFILCTTELHKVPGTIVSRCTQIQFSRATEEEMQRSFARVVKGEGKQVTEEALSYLARSVDGSFRDGVKLLDQALAAGKTVGLAEIELLVSGSIGHNIDGLIQALVAKQASVALSELNKAIDSGVDLSYLLVSLMRGLRDKLLAGEVEIEVTKLIYSLDEVARRIATSLDGQLLAQVAIVEWCGPAPAENNQSPSTNLPPQTGNQAKPNKSTIKQTSAQPQVTKKAEDERDGGEVWQKLMGSLNSDSATLGALLSQVGQATIQGDELMIQVRYGFHKDQIMSEKTLHKLEQMVSTVIGRNMRIKCEVAISTEAKQAQGDDIIEEAVAIFTS